METKEYASEKKPKYIELFVEIMEGAEKCNNVSILRAYADKAQALKIRLLNEMDALDAEILKKKAEEEKKAGEKDGNASVDITVSVPIKNTKNITIKNIAKTSSWRIEKEEDVDKYINELRSSLIKELSVEGVDIVNVEF